MNFVESSLEKKAKHFAADLLEQAKRNEPSITADLLEIAMEVSAETAGLENKFKSLKSLTEKLINESPKSAKSFFGSRYSTEQAVEESAKRQAARNNDALRYTLILPFEKYVFGFKKSLEDLKRREYQIPEEKIWNAWKNIGTVFDKGYRGINITVVSSRKQKFELQFHTRASYELKTETHFLYEESRQNRTSQERKIEIAEIIVGLARAIKMPKGVKKV